eukprot:m.31765 g.31765  ORF g.31765 m.31765 type:complete len:216 (-) comp8347_c0_seq2:349-996(-)
MSWGFLGNEYHGQNNNNNIEQQYRTLCSNMSVFLFTVLMAATQTSASNDAGLCESIVNTIQGDFRAMLAEPDPTKRLPIAQGLAARFEEDGVMADPAWLPHTGHQAIAQAETATYQSVPNCTQQLTWSLPRIVAGNSSFPPPVGNPVNIFCAVDVEFNITLTSTSSAKTCSVPGKETDTAIINSKTGMLKNFATIYDYAGFAAEFMGCVGKVCGK